MPTFDDMPEIFTTDELAEWLGVSRRALEDWRKRGNGPPFVQTGRTVRYMRPSVEEWISNNERTKRATNGLES